MHELRYKILFSADEKGYIKIGNSFFLEIINFKQQADLMKIIMKLVY